MPATRPTITVDVERLLVEAESYGGAPFVPTTPLLTYGGSAVGTLAVQLDAAGILAAMAAESHAFAAESYEPGYGDGLAGVSVGSTIRLRGASVETAATALDDLANLAQRHQLHTVGGDGLTITGEPDTIASALRELAHRVRSAGITWGTAEQEAHAARQAARDVAAVTA